MSEIAIQDPALFFNQVQKPVSRNASQQTKQAKEKPTLETSLVRMVLQGGCQCRKVRYTVDFDEATAQKNFCHCRMCQLATGSPVSAFFTVQEVRLFPNQSAAILKSQRPLRTHTLHRAQADVKFEGTLGVYQSSEKAVRKFCTNCGTPLVFQLVGNANKVRSKE